MAQAILRFEIVFVHHVIMGYVAIVAMGPAPVAAMRPCGILRGHNMAVHAGFGLIAQVRWCFRPVQHQQSNTCENTQHNNDRYFPLIGGGVQTIAKIVS